MVAAGFSLRCIYPLTSTRAKISPDVTRIWAQAEACGYHAVISLISQTTSNKANGFVLLARRWVIERTFGWLNRSRRLSKDYERYPESSEAFIYLSMIHLMTKRLARQQIGFG